MSTSLRPGSSQLPMHVDRQVTACSRQSDEDAVVPEAPQIDFLNLDGCFLRNLECGISSFALNRDTIVRCQGDRQFCVSEEFDAFPFR